MSWEKVPQSHIDAFHAAFPKHPGAEIKKMFGCPAGFVNGNMFCGTHERNMIVRLDEKSREAAVRSQGCQPFEPMGRPMKEYVRLPAECIADVKCLAKWFVKALTFVETLPAKSAPKKKATKKS